MIDPAAAGRRRSGIIKFVLGDIFVIPAMLLIFLETPVQSPLWGILAIPGLLLYALAVMDFVKK